MLGNSHNPDVQRIEQEEFLKSCFTKEELEKLRNGDKVENNDEENKIEWKKEGYLITVNRKIAYLKKGDVKDNVMDYEEAKMMLKFIKSIAKESRYNSVMGFNSVTLGNAIIEMIHTSVIDKVIKEPLEAVSPVDYNAINAVKHTDLFNPQHQPTPCPYNPLGCFGR